MEKAFQEGRSRKEEILFVPHLKDIKLVSVRSHREGYFISIKGKIHHEDVTILNTYAPNKRASAFVTETSPNLKLHIKPYILIVGDFCTPLLPDDRSTRQTLKREIMKLIDIIDQMGLTHIYRIFHPNTKEYIFF